MKHAPWPKLTCAGVVGFLLSLGALEAAAAPSGWLNVDGSIRFIAANGGTYDWADSGAAGGGPRDGHGHTTHAGRPLYPWEPRRPRGPPHPPPLAPGRRPGPPHPL